MRVEFDWQADSEEGKPETIAQTPRRVGLRLPVWARRSLVVVLAVLLLVSVGAYATLRVRYVRLRAEAERDIRSVMQVETRAIAQGDVGLYLTQQDEAAPAWYARQAERARSAVVLSDQARQAAPLPAIQDVDLRGDTAWVEVVEGDPPVRRARFYRRSGSRWVQTAPPSEFWGTEKELRTDGLIVRFYQRDERYVRAVLAHLTIVAGEVSQHLRFSGPGPSLVVYVSPEPEIRSAQGRAFSWRGVTLTSPWLTGIPADGEWDEEALQAATYQLAHELASDALRSANVPELTPLQKALVDEYAAWYSHGRDVGQAPLLGRVITMRGESELPKVFLSLRGSHLTTLFVLRWLSLHPTGDSVAYFETLLNVEREALLAGRKDTFALLQATSPENGALWFDDQREASAREDLAQPIRVDRVGIGGTYAVVKVRQPAPYVEHGRPCEAIGLGHRSPGAVTEDSVGVYALYSRDEESWDWKRVCQTSPNRG